MDSARYRPLLFMVLALLISWVVQTVLFLGLVPLPIGVYMYVPAAVAFGLFLTMGDRWRVQARLFTAKPVLRQVAFAVGFPLVWFSLASVVAIVLGVGEFNPSFIGTLVSLPYLSTVLVSLLIFLPQGFGEEYGWRGYLQPALEKRYSRAVAAVIVGVVWASWHIPSYYISYSKANMGNPYLLTLLGMSVGVVVAFPYAYCFGLSGNVLPLVLLHAVHDVIAQMVFFGAPSVPGLSEGSSGLIVIRWPAPLLMMLIAGLLMVPVFVWLFRRPDEGRKQIR